MLVIPAIDLKAGQCVRLRQGLMDQSTVFSDDPVATAAQWVEQGARRLHLVDLDGAFAGEPVNGAIQYYVDAGVSYVIIGTKAVQDPEFVREACRQYPGRVIVGLDAKEGLVATDGWAEVSSIKATDLAAQFAGDGVTAIIYTDIARDGMMNGVNVEATVEMAAASPIPVIASGGVSRLEDIKALQAQSHHGILGAITGRAIYEGTLDLAKAQAWCDQQSA